MLIEILLDNLIIQNILQIFVSDDSPGKIEQLATPCFPLTGKIMDSTEGPYTRYCGI